MTVDLAYELTRTSAPSPADPPAPTVVLLGSLGSNRTMWAPQIGPLSSVADVVAVDLRGHGASPVPPGPYSIADLGSDVVALLDRLAIARAHLVGLSMGGAVAQWLAVARPERVQSIALLCTAAQFGDQAPWLDRAAAVRSGGTGSIASAVVSRWFTPALAQRDRDLVDRMTAMLTDTDDDGYAWCCEAVAAWDGRADLTRITAPTLVIAGEHDPATPPTMLGEIADGVTGSALHVLPDAAHLANIEQAGPVTRLLIEHIGADAGRASARRIGEKVRRAVLGDAHVDRARASTTGFTAPFQDFITRTAWADVWARPGLDHRTRRLLTLATLTALGAEHELSLHIRAALDADVTLDDLAEVFLHTAVYAGVPRSNRAFELARAVLADPAYSRHSSGTRDSSSTGHLGPEEPS